jgi:hypothetical protein
MNLDIEGCWPCSSTWVRSLLGRSLSVTVPVTSIPDFSHELTTFTHTICYPYSVISHSSTVFKSSKSNLKRCFRCVPTSTLFKNPTLVPPTDTTPQHGLLLLYTSPLRPNCSRPLARSSNGATRKIRCEMGNSPREKSGNAGGSKDAPPRILRTAPRTKANRRVSTLWRGNDAKAGAWRVLTSWKGNDAKARAWRVLTSWKGNDAKARAWRVLTSWRGNDAKSWSWRVLTSWRKNDAKSKSWRVLTSR